MKREEKTAVVEEVATQIRESEAIFAIDYRGISVSQAAELRSKLREADASFRVVKNRLTKIAAKEAGREELDALLNGPTALTFVRGDTAMAAKAITGFNKEHEVLTYKGGFMEGLELDESRFTSISKLPSRDVLNGQFAGVVASPLTGLVRGLGSLISGLALQLGQIAEQGLVTGEAPAAEEAPAEDESPAEEDAPAEEAPSEPAADPVPEEEQPEASSDDEGGDTPAEDAPVEEDSAGSSAEAPEQPEPSQAEGEDEGDAADGDAAGDDQASDDSETSDDSDEKEQE